MMFLVSIPEDVQPKLKKRYNIITEAEYYDTDRDLLKSFSCPVCHEHELFRGCVYISCTGCLNYFSEKDIIEANI